ncbi:MAG: PhoH family protein [Christensenellales bacterium]
MIEQGVIVIDAHSIEQIQRLFGNFDENVRHLQEELGVDIAAREEGIALRGPMDKLEKAKTVVENLLVMASKGENIDAGCIRYASALVDEGRSEAVTEIMSDVITVTHRGKPIRCKTRGQKKYVESMKENTVVLAIGPAGTGKTYLAVAMAVLAFKNKEVSRIILTRPAVEAGEKLGFLPGDLQQKVDPYLRPLYDALYEMLGQETYQKLVERGVIEIAPLAYMRGRTLNEAFIILDEGQNTSKEQMKMFLTRLGFGSKMVVTGDITQVDLPDGKPSGLVEAIRVLREVEGIGVLELTHRDVVRHELVQSIIQAYTRHEKRKEGRK